MRDNIEKFTMRKKNRFELRSVVQVMLLQPLSMEIDYFLPKFLFNRILAIFCLLCVPRQMEMTRKKEEARKENFFIQTFNFIL